jgi:hypothetical protein
LYIDFWSIQKSILGFAIFEAPDGAGARFACHAEHPTNSTLMILHQGLIRGETGFEINTSIIDRPSGKQCGSAATMQQLLCVADLIQKYELRNCSDRMIGISFTRDYNHITEQFGWSIVLQPWDFREFEPGTLFFNLIDGGEELTPILLL